MRQAILVMSAAALAGGCTLGPDYERPDLDVPVEYVEPVPSGSAVCVSRLSFPAKGDGAKMLEGSEQEVAEQIADILIEKGVLT